MKAQEQPKTLTLYRLRSSRAALSAGYRLYVGNFRRIFRSAWPVAVVYALAMAVQSWYATNHLIPSMARGQRFTDANATSLPTAELLTWGGLLLFFFVMAAILASQGFAAMNEHRKTEQITPPEHWYGRLNLPMAGRALMVLVWLIVLAAIITALFVGVSFAMKGLSSVESLTSSIVSMAVFAVVGITLFIFTLPLTYTVTAHLLGPKFSLRPPVAGYGRGLSHVGMLFAIAIVVVLFTVVMTLVIQLPAVILYSATVKSQLGLAYGDPAGMPEAMSWVSLVVFTLSGFVQAWIHLSTLFPFYYAYGSIETERQERDAA